jgi:putative SOS response-associated peptidase YedK
MCYYNGVRVSRSEFIRLKEIEKELKLHNLMRPVTSGFDYGNWPVIRPNADNCDWDIVEMEWGFIPSYLRNRDAVNKFRRGYTDANGKFHVPMTTLNAIGEEMLQPGKMYRDAALNRRCLLLSSGFYEWRHEFPIGKKGLPLKTSLKYPYHITVKGDQEYFLIAGIWQNWVDKDTGESVDTCALVTTKANSLMEQVHNTKRRMPTILTEELAGEWISDGLSEERITQIATHQFPADQMQAHTIQKDFKTALDPTERFQYDGLSELVYN